METLRAKLLFKLKGITVTPASTITDTTIITPATTMGKGPRHHGNTQIFGTHWRGAAAHSLLSCFWVRGAVQLITGCQGLPLWSMTIASNAAWPCLVAVEK